MKTIITCVVPILVVNNNVYSQVDSLQQQINQHVWRPFIQSFNNLDTKDFMAGHSREMTRVIQDGYDLWIQQVLQRNGSGAPKDKKIKPQTSP